MLLHAHSLISLYSSDKVWCNSDIIGYSIVFLRVVLVVAMVMGWKVKIGHGLTWQQALFFLFVFFLLVWSLLGLLCDIFTFTILLTPLDNMTRVVILNHLMPVGSFRWENVVMRCWSTYFDNGGTGSQVLHVLAGWVPPASFVLSTCNPTWGMFHTAQGNVANRCDPSWC